MADLTSAQINDLRARVLNGDNVTADELRVALDSLRSSRRSAAIAGTPKKESASAAPAGFDASAFLALVAKKKAEIEQSQGTT